MIGAAMLSAKASVKTGAGYVCSSLPLEAAPAMHGFAPEVIVVGRSMESVIEKVLWADTLVIGCGLGREEGTMDFIEALLLHPEVARKKVVIDADALYAIGERQLLEKGLDMSNTILTPHRGEFSRLCGRTVEEIGLHPMEITREFASRWKVNILLKGSPTIVCSPSGTVLLNDSGTEALATAGSGDVLAGMIGAISAKGVEIVAAAAAAAWLHGRAGDLACDVSSLVSSADLLNAIPLALSELFTVGEL
jgi:hydroxyethylthiazole kinase-like uncharacterized protein yjeF